MRLLLVPILTYPPAVLVREVTKVIHVPRPARQAQFWFSFPHGWGEAPFNLKVKELVGGDQRMYREALTTIVHKWQKRGDIRPEAKPANVAKVMLSFFLGFIVQSAMIGGIDAETAAKGFENILTSQLAARR
jgi:hypothetical protein